MNGSFFVFSEKNKIFGSLYFNTGFFFFKERRQLGFVTLKDNLAVNLKPTHPPLLNGKGQFTFLKTKLSHSSGIVVYPISLDFLEINSFW